MSIEAMRNAVEAMDKHDFEMADHILCQAIAEAEKQEQGEPVAWIYSQGTAKTVSMNYVSGVRATPLYTTPQQRKPLTDEQIFEIHKQVDSMQYLTFARAIEAAHGIKENT